jgi:hypothetical protein
MGPGSHLENVHRNPKIILVQAITPEVDYVKRGYNLKIIISAKAVMMKCTI